jgi:hypothetical protein
VSARALLFAFLAAVLVGAGTYALLRPDPDPVEEPSPRTPSGKAAPTRTTPPPMLTGTIVLRVRTSDGKPLPSAALGGYRHGTDPRLRPLSAEGIVRFKDVPLVEPGPTRLEAMAQAPGYFPVTKEILVTRDVPNETVLTLTPAP